MSRITPIDHFYSNYMNTRKGCEFTKNKKRYVVVDYTLSHVYLVKLDHSLPLPFTLVHKVSYEKLNDKYVRY